MKKLNVFIIFSLVMILSFNFSFADEKTKDKPLKKQMKVTKLENKKQVKKVNNTKDVKKKIEDKKNTVDSLKKNKKLDSKNKSNSKVKQKSKSIDKEKKSKNKKNLEEVDKKDQEQKKVKDSKNTSDNLKTKTPKVEKDEKKSKEEKLAPKINVMSYRTSDAYTLTKKRRNVSFEIHRSGWRWMVEGLSHYWIDGKTAFCLQPRKKAGHNIEGFKKYDFISSGFSQNTKETLSKIVYCAWDTSAKTYKDNFTTQFMVWEHFGWKPVRITGSFTLSEYKNKKAIVLKKLEELDKKPSFNKKKYTALKGNTIKITDKNKQLSKMYFHGNESKSSITVNGNKISKSGNTLTIKAIGSSIKNKRIYLRKILEKHTGSSLVYYKNDYYQKFGMFKVLDPIKAFLNLDVKEVKGKIKLIKYDDKGKKRLGGAVFEVRDSKNKLVDKITSSSKGYVYSKLLPLGTYKIKEIKGIKGYIKSNYTFTRTLKSNGKDTVIYSSPIKAHNYKVWGKIKLIKYDDKGKKKLVGAVFEVRDSKNKLVDKITSSSKGYVYSKLLPLGTYKIKEIKAPSGYVKENYIYTRTLKSNGKDTVVLSSPIKVHNYKIWGKVKIIKIDEKTKKAISGAVFEIRDSKNKLIQTLKVNSKGYAESVLLKVGKYILQEIKAPEGYLLDSHKRTVYISSNSKTWLVKKNYTITNAKKHYGRIKIVKEDEQTSKRLKGVEFSIKNASGKLVQTIKTNNNGVAYSNKLEFGSYKVEEIKGINGYVLSKKIYTVVLKDNKKENITYYTLVVKNKPIKAKIRITKYNKKKDLKLSGAEFVIKDNSNKTVGKLITNKNGYAESKNLPLGNYTIKEEKAPVGYVLNDEIYEVQLESKDNKKDLIYYDLDITNEVIKAPVEITKVDISDKKPLPDTEISIYDDKDNLIESKVTNKEGIARFKELEYGKYYFKESKAPVGYVINTDKHYFEIKEDGKVVKSTLEDRKIKAPVEITKVDISDKKPLPNTEISIYDDNNNLVQKAVTDEKGVILFKPLVFGKYTLKETKAPKGYVLDKKVYKFNVTKNGNIRLFKAINKVITSTIFINKEDTISKKRLSDCEIVIKNASTGKVVFKGKTDENGQIKLDLEYGDYIYEEILAPKGYVKATKVGKFSVTEDGALIKQTLHNDKIPIKTVLKKNYLPKTGTSNINNFYAILFIFLGIFIFDYKIVCK